MPIYRSTMSVAAPQNWFCKETLMLLAPDGSTNVMVSSEPLDPTISTQQYAEMQGELLAREYPRFRQTRYEACLAFGSLPGFLRYFDWTPPGGDCLAQIQCYATSAGRGLTGTATAPSNEFYRHEAVLRQTLLSAVIAA